MRNGKALSEVELRFECTGCGDCCKTRGSYCYVYVSREERKRLAQHLGVSPHAFTRRYCQKTNGFFHLREPAKDCMFLDGARCSVYPARPNQCRTWPFWPENLKQRAWVQEVKRDCPGVGQGRLYTTQEVGRLLAEDRAHNKRLEAES